MNVKMHKNECEKWCKVFKTTKKNEKEAKFKQ